MTTTKVVDLLRDGRGVYGIGVPDAIDRPPSTSSPRRAAMNNHRFSPPSPDHETEQRAISLRKTLALLSGPSPMHPASGACRE
jgi:hypothetical protein